MEPETKSQTDSDVQAQEIKDKIVRAATQLFEEKGMYHTSLGEIAELADVSVPMAYSFVGRKSEIMLLIMEDFTDLFNSQILPAIEPLTDPKDKLQKATEIFYTIVDERAAQTLLLYRESKTLDKPGREKIMAAELEHVSIFQNILDLGVSQGIFKPHDTKMVAYNMVILAHAWVLKRWHHPKEFGLETYIKTQAQLVLDAVTA